MWFWAQLPKTNKELPRTTETNHVKVNDQISSELPVPKGVPQGSVFGPFFFLVYINNLPDIIMSTNFGYADDFKVRGNIPVTLNIDVKKNYKWCSDNFL